MTEHSDEPGGAPAPEPSGRAWWRVLMPAAPDVVALLVAQGELTVAGMDAFNQWSRGGGQDMAIAVRSAQHEAYHARRELLAALQAALSTPVDQEDLYSLSERIERILTEARDALREAEVLGCGPRRPYREDGCATRGGYPRARHQLRAIAHYPRRSGPAGGRCEHTVHHVERDYREAMAALLHDDNLRAVLAGQVLYRHYLGVARAIVAVADKLWFVVLRGA